MITEFNLFYNTRLLAESVGDKDFGKMRTVNPVFSEAGRTRIDLIRDTPRFKALPEKIQDLPDRVFSHKFDPKYPYDVEKDARGNVVRVFNTSSSKALEKQNRPKFANQPQAPLDIVKPTQSFPPTKVQNPPEKEKDPKYAGVAPTGKRAKREQEKAMRDLFETGLNEKGIFVDKHPYVLVERDGVSLRAHGSKEEMSKVRRDNSADDLRMVSTEELIARGGKIPSLVLKREPKPERNKSVPRPKPEGSTFILSGTQEYEDVRKIVAEEQGEAIAKAMSKQDLIALAHERAKVQHKNISMENKEFRRDIGNTEPGTAKAKKALAKVANLAKKDEGQFTGMPQHGFQAQTKVKKIEKATGPSAAERAKTNQAALRTMAEEAFKRYRDLSNEVLKRPLTDLELQDFEQAKRVVRNTPSLKEEMIKLEKEFMRSEEEKMAKALKQQPIRKAIPRSKH